MKDELLFCPLGGSGEIGMNMNLFAYGKPGEHKWIMVDIGVTFADDTLPGIDLIYPDPGFIVDKKDDLLGIILTHAHEDHIGAIAHLWPQLECKIFATPFTAVLIKEKFKEKNIDVTKFLPYRSFSCPNVIYREVKTSLHWLFRDRSARPAHRQGREYRCQKKK